MAPVPTRADPPYNNCPNRPRSRPVPVVSCPHCRTELEIDAGDYGYRMQCPACQSAFTPEDLAVRSAQPEPARRTPPPPPPPPPPAEPGTKVVTCSECRGQVTVGVEDLGHSMQCPLCDKVFQAEDPDRRSGRDRDRDGGGGRPWRRGSDRGGGMPRYDDYDDRPSRRPSRYDDDDDDRPRRRRRPYSRDDDSPDELISYAKRECSAPGVGLLIIAVWGLLSGIGALVLYTLMANGQLANLNPRAGGMGQWEVAFNIGLSVYQIVFSAFLLYAGIQMREAKQYTMCMIACVMVMIPLFSPCCLLGLIFGIMGVTKLNETRVKQGFEANRPGFDPDGYN